MKTTPAEKVDILLIMAHPDDAELSCAGIIASQVAQGYRVAMADLTAGEMGSRGNADLRIREAEEAARILGVVARENLRLADAFFRLDYMATLRVIELIRHYRPDIVITNALHDRHPDHGRAAQLVKEACFYAGLRRISTFRGGQEQEAWRPKEIFHVIQDEFIEPTFVVDVTPFWEVKKRAIAAFASQFYVPGVSETLSNEPETYISTPWFMERIEARGKEMGHFIGVDYGEGLVATKPLAVASLPLLLRQKA
jgi:bacillithiol biosynthesis deacetylase BshB1